MCEQCSAVRAAAVSALAKFAFRCPSLRASIATLLRRCVLDVDDEVRDRCNLYLAMLEDSTGNAEGEVAINEDALVMLDRTPVRFFFFYVT